MGEPPEGHRIRVAPLLERAEREMRDAEHSERGGDCRRAVEALLAGRAAVEAAREHARSAEDADARESVKNFVEHDWRGAEARILRRCVRAKPARPVQGRRS
jgi:hypothetical protein